MKRLISLILVLSMIITVIPMKVFAQEEKGLEQAIKTVKSKFTIPEKLTEFNYDVYTRENKKVWNLSWNSKDGADGNINVTINENGVIEGYNYYKNYDYTQINKISKITKADAEKIAKDFIKKVNPKLLAQLKLIDNNQTYLMDNVYSFNFIRLVNNIPFSTNNVSININRQEGYVQNYYYNWTDNLTFPAADKVISLEQAQKDYKEKLGLNLKYFYKTDKDNNITTYLAYASKYNNYYIDAVTGEKIELQGFYPGPYYAADQSIMKSDNKAPEVKLTDQELKAIDEVSKVMTKEEAEKIARSVRELELTDEFKANSVSLSKDWNDSKRMIWSMEFSKSSKENDYTNYISVRLNAKTGEILSFYKNDYYVNDTKAIYDEKTSKSKVDEFLKQFNADKYSKVIFDDSFNGNIRPLLETSVQNELPTSYTFRYIRNVNGVSFDSNYVTIGFNAITGKISNYELSWFDNAKFSSIDKAVAIDEVYNKVFKEIGLELQYVSKYNSDVYEKYYSYMPGNTEGKQEIKLVYGINPNKPLIIDAFKNIILNYNGESYKDTNSTKYSDIEESYAKDQINSIAEYGIKFDDEKFNPSSAITQKDYLYLISKLFYGYSVYSPLSSKQVITDMYNNLIREGIVKQEEKAPNSIVTREDSIKFLIRAMKYDKVADIKNIYNCTFVDKDQINTDLIGYITIANGMNIIGGDNGYFSPKSNLLREDAAVIIYNYLKR